MKAQSLESGEVCMTGVLYSHMGDAYMGLADVDNIPDPSNLRLRGMRVSRAELYIDRARECKLCIAGPSELEAQCIDESSGFHKTEDFEAECEQLMKKSLIAKLRGDEDLAEQWAQNHNRVWESGLDRIAGGYTKSG